MLVSVVLIWRWAILPSLPLLQKTVTDVTSRGRSDCKTAQLLASGLWLNRLLANERVANVTNDHKQKSAWAHKLIRKVFTVIKLESCFVDFFTIQSFCWSSDRMQFWGQLYYFRSYLNLCSICNIVSHRTAAFSHFIVSRQGSTFTLAIQNH